MIICKDLDIRDQIITLDDWKEKCPPERGDYHWQDGRSSKELAKEWVNKKGEALKRLLSQHSDFQGINFIKASPELETRFDRFGRGRKHDLLVIGEKEGKKIIISVEAKVNEGFGNYTVGDYYMKAIIERLNGATTQIPDRIARLIQALFKRPYSNRIMHLQYQLLHAIAGTLVEAEKQEVAKTLFIVHTFRTNKTDIDKNKTNDKKLDDFINVISSNEYKGIQKETIVGPVLVQGNTYIPSNIPLYIGKI